MIEYAGNKVKEFTFAGGEEHLELPTVLKGERKYKEVIIRAIIENSSDVMRLLLVCDAHKRKYPYSEILLVIPYFPYARQDRVCNEGEPHSLKVMSDLINSIGAKYVQVSDPHSDVVEALVNNLRIEHQRTLVPQRILRDKLLVCPDAGAEKKITKFNQSYIMCRKIRNPINGEILETKVDTDGYHITGRDLLIIDDICDGGRTFIEIAKVLREHKPKSIELYVTHGIFSKGFDVFKNLIDKVHYLDYNSTNIITKEVH